MPHVESPVLTLTPAPIATAEPSPPARLIADLDRRQDELLSEIDELNHRIEAALGKLSTEPEAA